MPGIAREAVLPELIGQDDDGVGSGDALLVAKGAAERERMAVAEHGEEPGSGDPGAHALGTVRGREVHSAAAPGVDVGECGRLPLPCHVALRRRADAIGVLVFPDHDQAVRLVVRQRREEEAVDDAEDRGGRSDPERQRDHRDER